MQKSFAILQEELREFYTTNAQGKPENWAQNTISDFVYQQEAEYRQRRAEREREEFEKALPKALAFLSEKVIGIIDKWPTHFNTPHEAYAVLLEEVDELWEEVKKNESVHDYHKIMQETADIAAVAIRMLVQFNNSRAGVTSFFHSNL